MRSELHELTYRIRRTNSVEDVGLPIRCGTRITLLLAMAATTTTMIQQRSVISFENRTHVAELGITRAAADAADHHHHADHHLRRQLLVVRLQVPCRNSKNHGIRGSCAVIPNRIKSRKKDSPAICYAFSSPDGETPPRDSGALESVAEAVEKATATVNDRKVRFRV